MNTDATDRIAYLLDRYTGRQASGPELEELTMLLKDKQQEATFLQLLEERAVREQEPFPYTEQQLEALYQTLLAKRRANKAVVIRLMKRVAVAASIVLAVGVGIYYIVSKKPSTDVPQVTAAANDVPAPDKNRAQIKLSDGSIIYLDSAVNGELAQQGNVKVVKDSDGKIAYSGSLTTGPELVEGPPLTNTLTNPRGSRVIDMTLADGSRVWLNAGSSITYPVAFTGNERKVNITGEAYFEVAHNVSKPFYVSKGDVNVQVLGTHFNVNAYDDEENIKVTLLEGKVRVTNSQSPIPNSIVLKPGQQAVSHDSRFITHENIDLEAVMAWKNGLFHFQEASIETIMQELARWYDIDVRYEAKIDQHYVGKIYRQSNISEVLKMLETVGGVHFKVEGKSVTVKK